MKKIYFRLVTVSLLILFAINITLAQTINIPTGTNAVTSSNTGNSGIDNANPTQKIVLMHQNTSTDLSQSHGYGLKIYNSSWLSNQFTGIEFWNGLNKTVPSSRIVSQMAGNGAAGENLHFQTQSLIPGSSPNLTQPTTKMVILNNGNIGIGSTTPGVKLYVDGEVGTTSNIRFFTPTSSSIYTNGYSKDIKIDASNVLIQSASTGNVGVGISAPQSKLHIDNGSLRIGNYSDQNSRSNNFLSIGDNNVKIGEWETDNMMSFSATGYSFIGNGNISFNANSLKLQANEALFIGGTNIGESRLYLTNTNIHSYIDYKDNLYFRADNPNTSSLVLQGDGSVGVGFSTSYLNGKRHTEGYKFAVNGGILCEEVKVILDVPNSDHVFKEDYKLLTLNELENYINTNSHLPEVPSAEEFKKNGYKVGEMDDLLLRKIEELTLYIIAQEKRIKELEEMYDRSNKANNEVK